MTRGPETCADCCSPDPSWASINRLVLICDDCCAAHRSLGRHISHVKCLKKGIWSASQLGMVHSLPHNKANSIWECSLTESSSAQKNKKKPSPRDTPAAKADYIKLKYHQNAFLPQVGKDESDIVTTQDLNKELHASVRSDNIETSLRLLALGADPCYFHSEKGTFSLHQAARSGQPSQVELLLAYGADPAALDTLGHTPWRAAKAAGHEDIAERLVECQYEVTDRLAMYLCGKKPDHSQGQHFIIPEMTGGHSEEDEAVKTARKKLQSLNHRLFEELMKDIYDEVDRRETDAIWLSTQQHGSLVTDRQTIPFLPVNEGFSATRNQGRQKLARLTGREMAIMIIDVLAEARRRLGLASGGGPLSSPSSTTTSSGGVRSQHRSPLSSTTSFSTTPKFPTGSRPATPAAQSSPHRVKAGGGGGLGPVAQLQQQLSDEEPLYDSVASDEDSLDYHLLQHDLSAVDSTSFKTASTSTPGARPSGGGDSGVGRVLNKTSSGDMSTSRSPNMTTALKSSNAQVERLVAMQGDMRQEVKLLQYMVQKLVAENSALRERMESHERGPCGTLPGAPDQQEHGAATDLPAVEVRRRAADDTAAALRSYASGSAPADLDAQGHGTEAGGRPQSMYEARDPKRPAYGYKPSRLVGKGSSSLGHVTTTSTIAEESSTGSWRTGSLPPPELPRTPSPGTKLSPGGETRDIREATPYDNPRGLPPGELVLEKTNLITRRIQHFFILARQGDLRGCMESSASVMSSIEDMTSIFPQHISKPDIREALQNLELSGRRLQISCERSHESNILETEEAADQTQELIQGAYDVAKAAKALVTSVPSSN